MSTHQIRLWYSPIAIHPVLAGSACSHHCLSWVPLAHFVWSWSGSACSPCLGWVGCSSACSSHPGLAPRVAGFLSIPASGYMWAEYLRASGTSLEVLGIGEVYVSSHSGVVHITIAKWYKTIGGSSYVFFESSFLLYTCWSLSRTLL